MADPTELLRMLNESDPAQQNQQNQPDPTALLRQLDGTMENPERNLPPGYTVVKTVEVDGVTGRIYRKPDGTMGYSGPNMSTENPETVKRILEGATPGESSAAGFNEEIIAQHPIAARGSSFVQGAPFVGSYADEAVSAAFGEDAGSAMRAGQDAMRDVRPGQAAALNLAGGITGAVGAAAVGGPMLTGPAANMGTAGRAAYYGATGGLAGATEGAVYGSGEGESGNRLEAAQRGALMGGGTGAVIGAAAPIAGRSAEAVITWLKNNRAGIGRSDVNAIAKELGVSPKAAAVVQRYVANDNFDGAAMALLGDDAMLADAGKSTTAMLDAAVATGGRPANTVVDAVRDRATQANTKLTGALDSTLGKPSGVQGASRDIATRTASARKQAYDQAYSNKINYASPKGREVEDVLGRISPDVLSRAVKEANEEMLANGDVNRQIMAKIADDGSVSFVEMPNVQQLDEIKKALGRLAEGEKDSVTGQYTSKGVRMNKLARLLRDATGDAAPDYKRAVRLGGDKIEEQNALIMGRNIFKPSTTREQVASTMKGASREAKQAAMTGMRGMIDDTLARVKGTAANPDTDIREVQQAVAMLTSRDAKDKMRMILGPQSAAKMITALDEASTRLSLLSGIAANSKTATRQSIQGDVKDAVSRNSAIGWIFDGQNAMQTTKRVVMALTGNTPEAQKLREQGLFDEIAQVLVNTRGDKARDALRVIQNATDTQKISESQARIVADALTGSAALLSYQGATPRQSTQ